MAQDNIYDLAISELIYRLDDASISNSASPSLVITNSLGQSTVPENYNGPVTFTTTAINIPLGYTVTASSHVLTFPNATPPVTGSTDVVAGATVMILGAVGSTFVVTSTITLEHATDPDIILNGSQTITSVLPIYYGIKPFEVTPDTTSLSEISSQENQFDMTNSSIGRLNVVIPTATGNMVSVTDHNGLVIPLSSFLKTTIGSFDHYVLVYDTQLTGTNIKTFTINYV